MNQINSATIQAYRDVFFTEEGKEVLKDILNDHAYFATDLANDEERILHNAASKILAKLGIMLPGQIDAQVDAWTTITPPKEI